MMRSSYGQNPYCGFFIKIITQSFLLILLRTCGAYAGENPTTERCQTEIHWKPIHYYIKISTDIHKNETSFRGLVVIDGVVLQDTNEVFLHSKLNITEAYYITGVLWWEIDLKLARETNENITLMLNKTLPRDQSFKLMVVYNGDMNTNPGIYVSYYNSTNGPRPVVSTELEPMGARFVFPCLDLPRFKATFAITVARPQSMVALSNMELDVTTPPDPAEYNQVWDYFHPTPNMSTYLVSIVICDDYQNVSLSRNSFYWFPRESRDAVSFLASHKSNEFLSILETYTGINYTLSKLDHVIIPEKKDFVLAMENWGLVTWKYRFVEMGSKKDRLKKESGLIYDVTLVHEIAHQWFGNLVTCRYWCYFWLNEGFTEFMGYHILNEFKPFDKAKELFILDDVNSVMVSELEHPIHLVDEDKCCSNEIFDLPEVFPMKFFIKGAAITTMLESNILSNGTFRKGIQRYLNNNMYKTVTNQELWEAFQEVREETSIRTIPEGTTFETVMDTWIHDGGFPVVHLYRFENGSVAVSQEEFLLGQENNSTIYWWIPLTYTTTSKKDFSSLGVQEWLSPNGDLKIIDTNISENEWIIFNIQQKGYYKVNYDLKTWDIITEHLMNGTIEDIHPMNRASLLNDAFMLAHSEFTNYTVALNLSKYLVRETNYFPLKVGKDVFSDLGHSLRVNSSVYYKFMDYCRFVFNGIFQNCKPSGCFNTTDLPSSWVRTLIIQNSCEFEVLPCRQEALKCAESIINQIRTEDHIEPLLRYTLWCSAVKLGGNMVFDYVNNKYLNETVKDENHDLLFSLFCADKEKIPSLVKERLLNVDNFKDNKTIENIFGKIFFKKNVFCPAVNYINDNYDTVASSIGDKVLARAFNITNFEPLDEECRDKAVELISKLDKTIYIAHNATTMDNSLIANINSWLDEQNLTMEVYSEEKNTFITEDNCFLFGNDFHIYD